MNIEELAKNFDPASMGEGVFVEKEDMQESQAAAPAAPGFLEKLLNAKPGPGSISDYKEHPLNFRKTDGLAQVVRGVTGLAGDLERAFIDVVFGLLREIWEVKKEAPPGGNIPV
jgi:hypothetical protein